MNRRDFLKAAAAGFALSTLGGYVAHAAEQKTYRVGLIGTGWYGKSDLFRLIQVSPVEVVSLCDPDKHMLAEAADLTAQRQKNKKRPRLYGDYREMLKEKDLDIVLVGSPDHWHSLQMIAAVEAGADVYCQKPISCDVLEGEAMVAAARKHNKVVQVGTQRKSTPHLIDVKKNIVETGMLGKIGHVELCCYFHMRANGNPPVQPVPDFFDYETWTGPAPLRPYDGLPHVRWWRTFMEYGNGICGDMCVHMYDTARWILNLGWPKKVTSVGGILVQKEGKSNIADTQVATFEHPEFNVVWQHRTWGTAPDPDYPWAIFIHGEKGTLKASTMRADFIPDGNGEKIHKDVVYEKEQFPEDVTEKDIELNAAPATRLHMKDFLAAIEKRGKPVADIQEGHTSTASCILANVSMALGGRPLVYDPAKRLVVGDAEATRLLRRPWRAGYKHPGDALA
ncbi:MAG: Gfo/Idh/MocA family oxidoreductase [Tepidisphaeraceae bacterium]|jgi:predicted dehydrogenase